MMSTEELRSLVLECLRREVKKPYDPHRLFQVETTLFGEVALIAHQRKLRFTKGGIDYDVAPESHGHVGLHVQLHASVWDIVWDLIIEGLIRPGTGTERKFDLPCIHVTEYGKQVLQDPATPHDPDGYLRRLKETIPNVDEVIWRYISESAETLRRNCLLSSTVTLGCAAEKAFLLLVDAAYAALGTSDQPSFEKSILSQRFVKSKHVAFMKWYSTKLQAKLKASVSDSDWMTAVDNALAFVFEYFRDVRNDAGHPTGVVLPREVVQSHLVLFRSYLRVIYDLIDWLGKNTPL